MCYYDFTILSVSLHDVVRNMTVTLILSYFFSLGLVYLCVINNFQSGGPVNK